MSHEFLRELGKATLEGITSGVHDAREREFSKARDDEWSQGYQRCLSALCEATEDDDTVARLISKYWAISFQSAHEDATHERIIQAPLNALIKFLIDEERYTESEAARFIETHRVRCRIERDKELRKLSPHQLFSALMKLDEK